MGISYATNQGGTLPNLSDMGFKWQDYFAEIDANDPFFATIMASVSINADFDQYGINSCGLTLRIYQDNPPTIKDFHFKKPDDNGKFDCDTKDGDMTTPIRSRSITRISRNHTSRC